MNACTFVCIFMSTVEFVVSTLVGVLYRGNPMVKRLTHLDIPTIRNANRGDSRESMRRTTPYSITCQRFARIASKLRFAIFSPPNRDSQKRGFSSGTPETIRENQVIRANLRIDSRESGPVPALWPALPILGLRLCQHSRQHPWKFVLVPSNQHLNSRTTHN